MTEIDNKLIQDFLAPAKQELEDNGFSQRVMRALPKQRDAHKLSQQWTVCCTLIGIVTFIYMDGWKEVFSWLRETYIALMKHNVFDLDPTMLLTVGAILSGLTFYRALSAAKEL